MITLYSTHCPKCHVLELKLKAKNIEYNEINDFDLMKQMGFSEVPMLDVDGKLMNYLEAVAWLNKPESDGV